MVSVFVKSKQHYKCDYFSYIRTFFYKNTFNLAFLVSSWFYDVAYLIKINSDLWLLLVTGVNNSKRYRFAL